MKTCLFIFLIFFTQSFACRNKVTQEIKDQKELLDTTGHISGSDTVNMNLAVKGAAHILTYGISQRRIDSLKQEGLRRGGRPLPDSQIANFLILSDSIRRIGKYALKYNGKYFSNQNDNPQQNGLSGEKITEEYRNILSVTSKPTFQHGGPMQLTRLEFYNQQRLVKIFRPENSNPYISSKARKIKTQVFPAASRISIHLNPGSIDWEKHAKEYHTYHEYRIQDNGIILIDYSLNAIDEFGGLLGTLSTVLVLDSTGHEKSRLENLGGDLRNYRVAENGRYLLVNGGGILGEGFQRMDNPFLKIYELKSKQLIYQESLEVLEGEYSDFYESEEPNKISVSYSSYRKTKDKQFTELIFDLRSRKRCEKTISLADWERIINERIKYSGNVWLREFDFGCKTF